jgi:hypothetical protein
MRVLGGGGLPLKRTDLAVDLLLTDPLVDPFIDDFGVRGVETADVADEELEFPIWLCILKSPKCKYL